MPLPKKISDCNFLYFIFLFLNYLSTYNKMVISLIFIKFLRDFVINILFIINLDFIKFKFKKRNFVKPESSE